MTNQQMAEVIFTTMIEVPFIKLALKGREEKFFDIMEHELRNVDHNDFIAGQVAGAIAMNEIVEEMDSAERLSLTLDMMKLPGFKDLVSLPKDRQAEIVSNMLAPRIEARVKAIEEQEASIA